MNLNLLPARTDMYTGTNQVTKGTACISLFYRFIHRKTQIKFLLQMPVPEEYYTLAQQTLPIVPLIHNTNTKNKDNHFQSRLSMSLTTAFTLSSGKIVLSSVMSPLIEEASAEGTLPPCAFTANS